MAGLPTRTRPARRRHGSDPAHMTSDCPPSASERSNVDCREAVVPLIRALGELPCGTVSTYERISTICEAVGRHSEPSLPVDAEATASIPGSPSVKATTRPGVTAPTQPHDHRSELDCPGHAEGLVEHRGRRLRGETPGIVGHCARSPARSEWVTSGWSGRRSGHSGGRGCRAARLGLESPPVRRSSRRPDDRSR